MTSLRHSDDWPESPKEGYTNIHDNALANETTA